MQWVVVSERMNTVSPLSLEKDLNSRNDLIGSSYITYDTPKHQSNSYKLQVPKHKQFLMITTVQFLFGPCPGPLNLLTNSSTTGGSFNAETTPHRLHLLTLPGNSRCFRNVSHNATFGAGSRCCAPGGRTDDRPSHVVSKKITAGISRGDCVPINRSVTVYIAFRNDRGTTDSRNSLFSISCLFGCSIIRCVEMLRWYLKESSP